MRPDCVAGLAMRPLALADATGIAGGIRREVGRGLRVATRRQVVEGGCPIATGVPDHLPPVTGGLFHRIEDRPERGSAASSVRPPGLQGPANRGRQAGPGLC